MAVTQAALKTNDAFIAQERQTIQQALKENYIFIQPMLPDGMLPKPDKVTDADIATLADEVIGSPSGLTPRAQQIRDLLKANRPDDYEMLANADKMRRAAVEAVDENTSDKTGSASIMNMLAGFFKWIFSGFKGGWDGLKTDIAQVTASHTEAAFKANLEAQGIDTKQASVRTAMGNFNQEVEAAAGLRPPVAKPQFDLASVEMKGVYKPPATPEADTSAAVTTGGRANLHADIAASYKSAADALERQFGQMVPAESKPMFTQAQAELVATGTALTEQALKNHKPVPSSAAIIEQTFRNLKSKLGSNEMVDSVVAAFDKNRGGSLASVVETLKASTNGAMAAVVISSMGNDLDATRPALAGLSADASTVATGKPVAPPKPKVDTALEAARVHGELIQGLKEQVAHTMQEHPMDVGQIQTVIDAQVTKTAQKYPMGIGSVIDSYLPKGLLTPSDDERHTLAKFIAGTMPSIVESTIDNDMDKKPKSLSPDAVVKESIARFDAAFDEGIRSGHISQVWKDHKAEIESGIASEMHKRMDEGVSNIARILKAEPYNAPAGGGTQVAGNGYVPPLKTPSAARDSEHGI